jgi:hypothetical protein
MNRKAGLLGRHKVGPIDCRRSCPIIKGMDLEAFRASLREKDAPRGIGRAVEGLWWDAKGDWDKAHDCAQAQDDRDGAWLHAYLHRKEGDAENAAYWYRRAGRPAATGAPAREWEAIARALLGGD